MMIPQQNGAQIDLCLDAKGWPLLDGSPVATVVLAEEQIVLATPKGCATISMNEYLSALEQPREHSLSPRPE